MLMYGYSFLIDCFLDVRIVILTDLLMILQVESQQKLNFYWHENKACVM